ncbi:chemotaxis protein CheD [Rugamonas sp.]|uniref:chemotaxis protein CheD n=1 Tax=Rugamonas sp. TaxID=1926287 RepID=UPI0025F5FB7A|nr:chemotaxis protein CheD [Rugamonas sp.]
MMNQQREQQPHQVGMGQLKIGCHSERLQAVLGSCVGIGFIWKKGGRCGLAHCLLPEAPQEDACLGARYVSQAVPSLLRLMGVRVEDYPDVEVILAGGASMFGGESSRLRIGQQNVAAAQKYLQQCGLNVRYTDLGGKRGRQMQIDCTDQTFSITDLVALTPESAYDHV